MAPGPPFSVGDSLPERLRAYRRIHGISRKKLAGMLGVDESTLWRWEIGQRWPHGEYASESGRCWHKSDERGSTTET